MKVEFKLKGGPELITALNKLEGKTERSLGRQALRAGARVIMKEARRRAPRGRTGRLRRAKGWAIKAVGVKQGVIRIAFGTRGGNDAPWYAHLVEFGTKPHTLGRRDDVERLQSISAQKHPGAKAQPFFRPAVDEKSQEALQVIGKKLFDLLVKESKK